MKDNEVGKDRVPFPLDQAVQDVLSSIIPKTNATPASFSTASIHWPSTPLPNSQVPGVSVPPSTATMWNNIGKTVVGGLAVIGGGLEIAGGFTIVERPNWRIL